MREFLLQIKKYLFLIPKIIWYPIETIIFTIHQIVYRINFSIHDCFNKEKYYENRLCRLIKHAVNTTLSNHNNILDSYLSKNVAKIFTLLLQIISFITTYAGFTFFLGTLNPVAPLFMAIVVQGGCYYLFNYTSSNKRSGNWRKNFLLIVLIAISFLTSYMGIFDSIVNPADRIKNIYNNYKTATDTLIDYYENETIHTNYQNSDIENTYNFLSEISSNTQIQIESLQKSKDELSDTKQEAVVLTDNEGNEYLSYATIDNTDVQDKKSELELQINTLKKMKKVIDDFTSKTSLKDIQNIYSKYLDPNPKTRTSFDGDTSNNKTIYNEFQNAINQAKQLYIKLNTGAKISDLDDYKQLDLKNFSEEDKIRSSLSDVKPNEFELIKEKKESNNETTTTKVIQTSRNLLNDLNRFVVPENLINAENSRNLITSYVNENDRKITALLTSNPNITVSDDAKDNYKNALNDVNNIESVQIMAFTTPFIDPTTIRKAIFSIITALIVDGLSLLIAFALNIRKKSYLYYDSISDYRANREDMVEECLMYICLNDIKDNCRDITSRSKIKYIVANKINDIIYKFLTDGIHYCYFPDEFNAFAYISEDDIDSYDDDIKRVFITFCNISMIKAFEQKEIVELINHEFDENTTHSNAPEANKKLIEAYKNKFEKGKIYYIVSKSLHAWICENFSELLQSNILFYNEEKSRLEILNTYLGDDIID